MSESVYQIKRSFRIPLITIVVLLFVLFLLSLFKGGPWETIILAVLFLVALVVGIETAERKVIVDELGLKIKRFFRCKNLVWNDITHLGVVALNKKVYFLLTTTKGFYIFSNLLENHSAFIHSLVDRLGDDKVEVEIKNYLEHPVRRYGLIVMSWIAALLIVGVIVLKLSGV